MKFSTFIIIVLLSLIAYAQWRPAASPSALQEFVRMARQWIPPERTGGQESQPPIEQALPAPGKSESELLPGSPQPPPSSRSDASGNGKPSGALPPPASDPSVTSNNDALRKQYAGRVSQHLSGDCLLLHPVPQVKSGSAPYEEYILAGFPGAASLALDTQIDFYAYSGDVVPFDNDGEIENVLILVYSSSTDPTDPEIVKNPQPKENTPPPKPGAWMWERKGALDRGPYNRK